MCVMMWKFIIINLFMLNGTLFSFIYNITFYNLLKQFFMVISCTFILSQLVGGGWLYLCSFICLSAGVVEWYLLLCYYSIATCTFKGGISASAICIFGGLFLGFNKQVGLNRLHLAAMVAYPVVLHSALLHRGYSQRIGGR